MSSSRWADDAFGIDVKEGPQKIEQSKSHLDHTTAQVCCILLSIYTLHFYCKIYCILHLAFYKFI